MDVCIIGAGWSGLYACKYALENGMNPIVLERREDIGGVWNYSDRDDTTTVMKSTISSSSRIVTEASDFFMNEKVGEFMHHEEILDYLRDYIKHFGLAGHLNFNCEVKSVTKTDERWRIEYVQNGEVKSVTVDKVAVCAGLHNKQREIGAPIDQFSGSVKHSGSVKAIKPDDFGEDDHVIVYGGGETASDLVDLLVKTPAKITWAIRGGQHFLRKTLFHQRSGDGQFSKDDFALDLIASPLINGISSFSKSAPGRRYLTDWLSTGSVFKYQGHGVEQWKNEHKYARQFFNKNGHTVDHIHTGRVIAEDEITDVQDDMVSFKSGNSRNYTHIICCFGYHFHCPFLPEKYRTGNLEDLYQFVFPADDNSIAFLGFARPIIGSIPLITEMQCLWTFRVFSGKVKLKDQATLEARQVKINRKWDRRLPGRGNLRTLVLPSTYFATMLKEAYPGRSPGRELVKKPLRVLKFLSWIPSGSIRFAVDPDIDDKQFHEIWKQRSHGIVIGYLLPILFAISRLLHIESFVDWWVERRIRKSKNPTGASGMTETQSDEFPCNQQWSDFERDESQEADLLNDEQQANAA